MRYDTKKEFEQAQAAVMQVCVVISCFIVDCVLIWALVAWNQFAYWEWFVCRGKGTATAFHENHHIPGMWGIIIIDCALLCVGLFYAAVGAIVANKRILKWREKQARTQAQKILDQAKYRMEMRSNYWEALGYTRRTPTSNPAEMTLVEINQRREDETTIIPLGELGEDTIDMDFAHNPPKPGAWKE
jgi:hypothetical protein